MMVQPYTDVQVTEILLALAKVRPIFSLIPVRNITHLDIPDMEAWKETATAFSEYSIGTSPDDDQRNQEHLILRELDRIEYEIWSALLTIENPIMMRAGTIAFANSQIHSRSVSCPIHVDSCGYYDARNCFQYFLPQHTIIIFAESEIHAIGEYWRLPMSKNLKETEKLHHDRHTQGRVVSQSHTGKVVLHHPEWIQVLRLNPGEIG